ncbi:MAG: hypothetical protein RR221_06885 [Alistipes sp.]
MAKYDIDFTKLTMLLLPTFWRKGLLAVLACALTSSVMYLHSAFMQYRARINYRLTHNGQVCYLRSALNDAFDPIGRRITITEFLDEVSSTSVYMRCEGRAITLPRRDDGTSMIINSRGFTGAARYDFDVRVPVVLSGADDLRLWAMVSTYKLSAKRFTVTYISFIDKQ